MRAHNPKLDDGLDAGDFIRPDEEIYDALADLCHERKWKDKLDFEVHGGEVTLRGNVRSKKRSEEIEVSIKDLPGVREVFNHLSVS